MTTPFSKYQHGVVKICEVLHDSACGTGEPISEDRRDTLKNWLHLRLQHWDPPKVNKFVRYDAAIKALAEATLEEC